MKESLAWRRAQRIELARCTDRVSFLYVEHAAVSREDNALILATSEGVLQAPAAMLGCVILGPGTRISHQGVAVLADNGACLQWTGADSQRFVAAGAPLAGSSRLLMEQARLVSNPRLRVGVARRMYQMRFPTEDVSGLKIRELLGREGARVKRVYELESIRTGVQWRRRQYRPGLHHESDPVNAALTLGSSLLYGVSHVVINALGLSPGLGFVHSGTVTSFVYDVADLYKTDLVIPLAFDAAVAAPEHPARWVRAEFRRRSFATRLIERMVDDVRNLIDASVDLDRLSGDQMWLWSGGLSHVRAGANHAEEIEWSPSF